MSNPLKVRKKPVVVEAMLMTGAKESAFRVSAWCRGITSGASWHRPGAPIVREEEWSVTIPTREGDMTASPGDWVIRGIQGEFYPCKPDVFAATYEVLDED